MSQTLTVPKHKAALAKALAFDLEPARARVVAQILKANAAARVAVEEAMVGGAMLIEIRDALKARGGAWNQPNKPEALKFEIVLDEVIAETGCSKRTLYRWIEVAENGRKMLGESIDIDSLSVPVSNLLTMPEAEMGADAIEARQLLFGWMEDKTLNECRVGVVVDGDPAHRLTRAQNGKTKGGAGGDRKDYPVFALRKFSDLSTHFGHEMTAAQRSEVQALIPAAINGGTASLTRAGKTTTVQFNAWPEEFAEAAFEALRERFKGRKK